MSWFRPSHANQCQIDRLDQAERGLMASQADLSAEAEATTGAVAAVRESEEVKRTELRAKSEQVQQQTLHTSAMLRNVEDMLAEMQAGAAHRSRRH